MEQTLFTWQSWDELGEMAFIYYDVELVGELIPGFSPGVKFDGAEMDYSNGTLRLFNLGPADAEGSRAYSAEYKFKLAFVVTEE